MKVELHQNESVERRGFANLQRGRETVGGRIYLTNQRLIFVPHFLNLQREPLFLELATIKSIQKCWTKFLGVLPIWPNSLAIQVVSGDTHKFVLFSRSKWMADISSLSGANRQEHAM